VAARQAERWLALEYIGAVTLKTVNGFTSGGGLIGPQQYAVTTLTYGLLSLATMADATADVAAAFGGLILLGMLVRPALDKAGQRTSAGAQTISGLLGFVRGAGGRPPTYAQGVGAAATSAPGSTSGSSSSGSGDSSPIPGLPGLPTGPDLIPNLPGILPLPIVDFGNAVKDFLGL